jgi:hypothetical protein
VSWSPSLLPALRPGDRVALHWDWLCDVITPGQEAGIQRYEGRQLRLLGDADVPGQPNGQPGLGASSAKGLPAGST